MAGKASDSGAREGGGVELRMEVPEGVLRRLVESVAAELLARLSRLSGRGEGPERVAYTEEEAAALLGMRGHQLRDERRRGRVAASRVAGGAFRYTREDLAAYLLRDRYDRRGGAEA